MKDYSDDYDEERRTNLIAVIAQLQAIGEEQVGILMRICSSTSDLFRLVLLKKFY